MIKLSQNNATEITSYLHEKGFLKEKEHIIKLSVPGEGNMNVVLRAQTESRSFIIKQAPPYVQKYPDIPAPAERIAVEAEFYKATAKDEVGEKYMPSVLFYDESAYVLILEDLKEVKDLTQLYAQRTVPEPLINQLVKITKGIHNTALPTNYPENRKLKELNHQHIFVLPFMKENGFDLDSIQQGLGELALPFKEDEELKQKVNQLGEQYLSIGKTLLHGDYYPGSWMQLNENLYVLDPEFSFLGFKEFDLGVMLGHFILIDPAVYHSKTIEELLPNNTDLSLLYNIAGVEIIRRIIGLAQLPLECSLKEKKELLGLAKSLLVK